MTMTATKLFKYVRDGETFEIVENGIPGHFLGLLKVGDVLVKQDAGDGLNAIRKVDGYKLRFADNDTVRIVAASNQQTATPWIVHVTDGGAVYISDNHDFSKATFAIRMDGEQARAEQIVRDHNAHDSLVAALRQIQEHVTEANLSDGRVFVDEVDIMNWCDAALKLAEGEGGTCPRCGGGKVTRTDGRLFCDDCQQVTWTYAEGGAACSTNHFDVVSGGTCPRCGEVITRDDRGREVNPPEGRA